MKSAATIRTCSRIMMIIAILSSVIGGFVLQMIDDDYLFLMFIIWAVGIFGAVMMDALFQGFADIIDNTYAAACRAGGTVQEPVSKPVMTQKEAHLQELLDKGLISREEYDEQMRKEAK